MENIIQKNLERLTGRGEGDMPKATESESIGGTKDSEGRPCFGANFYYDSKSGEIVFFGVEPNVPKDILLKYSHGIFRIALDVKLTHRPNATGKNRIISHHFDFKINDYLKDVFSKTIQEYNERYAFSV